MLSIYDFFYHRRYILLICVLVLNWQSITRPFLRNFVGHKVVMCIVAIKCDNNVSEQFAKLSPDVDPGFSRLLGTMFYYRGLYEYAYPFLTRSWKDAGQTDVISGFFLAFVSRARGQTDDAAILLRTIGIAKKYRDKSWQDGLIAQSKGDYPTAEAAYLWAMQLDDRFFDAGYQLIGLYIAWNKPEKNREFIPILLSRDESRSSGRWWFAKGYLSILLGGYDEAISDLRLSLEYEPDNYITAYFLGNAFVKCGDFVSGEKLYLEAIRLNPSYVWPYIQLANVYELIDEKEKALQVIFQGLQALPKNPVLLTTLAELNETK